MSVLNIKALGSVLLAAALAQAAGQHPVVDPFEGLPGLELSPDPAHGAHVFLLPGTPECEGEAEKVCMSVVRKCSFGSGHVGEEGDECEVQCLAKQIPPLSPACLKSHPCAKDVENLCADAPKGGIMHCLHSQRLKLSPGCLHAEPCFSAPNFHESEACQHLHPLRPEGPSKGPLAAEHGGTGHMRAPRFHRNHHGAGGFLGGLLGGLFGAGGHGQHANHPGAHLGNAAGIHHGDEPHCHCLDECGPHLHDAICDPCDPAAIHPEHQQPGSAHHQAAESFAEGEGQPMEQGHHVTSVHAHGIPVTQKKQPPKRHAAPPHPPAPHVEVPAPHHAPVEVEAPQPEHHEYQYEEGQQEAQQQHHEPEAAVEHTGYPEEELSYSLEHGDGEQAAYAEEEAAAAAAETVSADDDDGGSSDGGDYPFPPPPPPSTYAHESGHEEGGQYYEGEGEGDSAYGDAAFMEASDAHAGASGDAEEQDSGSSQPALLLELETHASEPGMGIGQSHPASAADLTSHSLHTTGPASAVARAVAPVPVAAHHAGGPAHHNPHQQHQQQGHHQGHHPHHKGKKVCVRNPICGLKRNWCRVSPECKAKHNTMVADVTGCHGPYHGHRHHGCEAAIMSRLADKDNHPAPAVPQHVHDRIHKQHQHHNPHGKHHSGSKMRMGQDAAVEAKKRHAIHHIQRELHRCHLQEALSHAGEGKVCPKPTAAQWNAAHSGPLDEASLTKIKTCAPPPPFASFIRHFFDGLVGAGAQHASSAPVSAAAHPHGGHHANAGKTGVSSAERPGHSSVAVATHGEDEESYDEGEEEEDRPVGSHHEVSLHDSPHGAHSQLGAGVSSVGSSVGLGMGAAIQGQGSFERGGKRFAFSSHPQEQQPPHPQMPHPRQPLRLHRQASTSSSSAVPSSTSMLSYIVPSSLLVNRAANDVLVLYTVYFALALLVAVCLAACWCCVAARRKDAFSKDSPYAKGGARALLGIGALCQGCLGRLCFCSRFFPSVFGEKRPGIPANLRGQ